MFQCPKCILVHLLSWGNRCKSNYRWLIPCAAFVMLIIDYMWPLSTNGLFLFLIGISPFVIGFVAKISRHADGRLDIEMRNLAERIDVDVDVTEQQRKNVLEATGYEKLSTLFEQDANLALVWFRIEIEKRLRSIAPDRQSRTPTARLVKELNHAGYIPNNTYSILLDLLPALNSAAHGGYVSENAIRWIKDIAVDVLFSLDQVVANGNR